MATKHAFPGAFLDISSKTSCLYTYLPLNLTWQAKHWCKRQNFSTTALFSACLPQNSTSSFLAESTSMFSRDFLDLNFVSPSLFFNICLGCWKKSWGGGGVKKKNFKKNVKVFLRGYSLPWKFWVNYKRKWKDKTKNKQKNKKKKKAF